MAINSKETTEAPKYLKDLYPTFVPGTLAGAIPSNNRAYGQRMLADRHRVAYYALKNDPATRAIADDTEHAPLPYAGTGRMPRLLISPWCSSTPSSPTPPRPTSCS